MPLNSKSIDRDDPTRTSGDGDDARITLNGVRKSFDGETILDDFSLDVEPGSFVTLLGPSGCGKSTVLRLVAGLDRPEAGSVRAEADGIGYVLQDPTLMPWATALDNVMLPLRLEGRRARSPLSAAREALARVGLADAADKFPRELSGGMRMRVALARALVTRPRILLMDEPFAALDEITRFRLGDELTVLRETERPTVLFVTHSVFEAVALSDRVVVMGQGRVVADVTVEVAGRRGSEFRASSAFHAQATTISTALAAAMG